MAAFKCYQNMVVDSGVQTRKDRWENSKQASRNWRKARSEANSIVFGDNRAPLKEFYKKEYMRWNGIILRKRKNHTITGLFAKGD